jgi:MerC mercury resistance protein
MKNFFRFHIDSVGFWTSLVCGLHCALVPFMLTFFSWGYLTMLGSTVLETIIISVSFLLAVISLLPGYSDHKKRTPIVYVLVGFILIGFGRLDIARLWEMLLTPSGAVMIASAHFFNWKFSKQGRSHSTE